MLRSLLLVCGLLCSFSALAQSTFAPLNQDYYHLIDRYQIIRGELSNELHSTVKPYERKVIGAYISDVSADSIGWSKVDLENFQYLIADNWQWSDDSTSGLSKKPLLKHFYKRKPDLFNHQEQFLDLRVSPVIYWQAGKGSGDSEFLFTNTRGIQVFGSIDNKVGFYTYFTDTQAMFPEYVRAQTGNFSAVPGEGFWKTFKGGPAVDFLSARGYFTFNVTKHIAVQFGHDKNFIGNGYRSLILSDYSSTYTFLKLNTKIWKFNYTNLFTQKVAGIFTSGAGVPTGRGLLPKKYMAYHRLGVNIGKSLNIGLYESIAFGRQDSTSAGSFDINYLNPIVFYRSIEQQLGSKDNAIIGIDFNWIFLKHFSLYGQIVLDEFVLSEVKSGDGWWANKQALQLGAKYINAFGVNNLDLQGEVNIVRPYMYSHNDSVSNYMHYNQPIAHPLGANFYEFVGIAKYQPIQRLMFTGKLIVADYGLDTAGSNWGGNPLLDNRTREQGFGNTIGQGVSTQLLFLDFTTSFMIKHNLFADLKLIYRRQESELDVFDANSTIVSFAIRWNIAQRTDEF